MGERKWVDSRTFSNLFGEEGGKGGKGGRGEK